MLCKSINTKVYHGIYDYFAISIINVWYLLWLVISRLKHKQPELRPKGLGLGADKVVKENQKKNVTKDKDENLSIVKNAYVKITTGKYAGCYGRVNLF